MYKINTLSLVLLTLAAFATCAPREPDSHFAKKCKTKMKISNEEMNNFGDLKIDEIFTVERKFKCYIKCMVDEFHDRDANGKIDIKNNTERVLDRNATDRLIRIANECNDKYEIEEDECEFPFKFTVCVEMSIRVVDQK